VLLVLVSGSVLTAFLVLGGEGDGLGIAFHG
jgi:hypothetical protein